MPGYENVKQLIGEPTADLKELIGDRFPVPRLIITDQHKSQARFLLAKLNPAVTQANQSTGYGAQANELVYTDDVSLQVFLDHLAKLAVQGT
jgi:protein transport protein SEC23